MNPSLNPSRVAPRGTTRGRPVLGGPDASIVGWHLYHLVDPRSGATMYVGVTENPRLRWFAHAWNARKLKSRLGSWVRELLALAMLPEMRVVRPVPEGPSGRDEERAEIARLMAEGVPLLNERSLADVRVSRGKAYRERHRAAGLCDRCDRPRTQGVLCDDHAERNREKARLHRMLARAEVPS